jgi:hypothetical protein
MSAHVYLVVEINNIPVRFLYGTRATAWEGMDLMEDLNDGITRCYAIMEED